MSQFYLAGQGAIWLQPDGPNTEPKYLGCHSLMGIDVPKGDVTLYYCPDPAAPNRWKVDGSSQTAPGTVTFDIEMKIGKTADWLEKIKCPVPTYVLMNTCGRKDNFAFERAYALPKTYITTEAIANLSARTPDSQDEVLGTFSMASEDLYKAFEMVGVRKSTTEANALNDIASCSGEECAGDCGNGSDFCDILVIACDAGAGVTANVLRSIDHGASFAAVAADPFAINENIMSLECFQVNNTITRILAARALDAADNMEVAYSDNDGAVWSLVDIATPNNVGALSGGSLFVLDTNHIWIVLGLGYIAFSGDGGASFTVQDAGVTTVQPLYAVNFADVNVGFAVGSADAVLRTIDGGDTWALVTGTGGAGTLRSVFCLDQYRAWVGDAAGKLYYTGDGGLTWTQRRFAGDSAGVVTDIKFINELFGFIVGTSASDQVLRTIDGGYTWQNVTTPANSGINSLQLCGQNEFFGVGEAHALTGFIVKASN